MKDEYRTFIPPSSTCGPIYDFLFVFQVARVPESHEQPNLGWATVLMALAEEGSENDTSCR
jgi:hypothetical protein